ncbi:MAG: cation diffusion facilitator family transporter [Candidatus Accumulibacter sp.]|jgi:cation diffusion facilitator family transporter|nr:cation diffusion facilitator family transporter [Accumulibacter sp.]
MMQREWYGTLVSLAGVLCNLVLFAVKLAMGLAANSAAVLSDAFNNLTDAGCSLTLAIGFHAAGKAPDERHPFGHGRIEYISGLIVACLIMATGLAVGKFALERLLDPQPVGWNAFVCFGLICTMLVKIVMALFYRRANKTLQSPAIQAGVTDSLSDVAVTGVTLFSFVVSGCTAFPVDAATGLAVAGGIFFAGAKTAVDALDPLLGKRENPVIERQIRELVLATQGIENIHGLTVHDYGPSRKYASAHIEIAASMKFVEVHDAVEQAVDSVRKNLKMDIVLLPEPLGSDSNLPIAF